MSITPSIIRQVRSKVRPPAAVTTTTRGDTSDIIRTIMQAEKNSAADTRQAAQLLRGNTPTQSARNVWQFVSRTIRYRKDPSGHEIIKSPAQTVADGYADCKSMSLLAGSLLHNLDIEHTYRYAGYRGDTDYTHVYIVARIGGKQIPIDTTYHAFGTEATARFTCDLMPGQDKCPAPRAISRPTYISTSTRSPIWAVIALLIAAKIIIA